MLQATGFGFSIVRSETCLPHFTQCFHALKPTILCAAKCSRSAVSEVSEEFDGGLADTFPDNLSELRIVFRRCGVPTGPVGLAPPPCADPHIRDTGAAGMDRRVFL